MRRPVSKRKSARRFGRDARKTQVQNVKQPGRGGFRL